MKFSGLVLAVFVLVAILSIAESATTPKPKPKVAVRHTARKPIVAAKPLAPVNPCVVRAVCTPGPSKVYATDGLTCVPLSSKCELTNINCDRAVQNRIPFQEVKQSICQGLCNKVCVDDTLPLCAEFNGKFTMFTSQCAMENNICLTGIPYKASTPENCGLRIDVYNF